MLGIREFLSFVFFRYKEAFALEFVERFLDYFGATDQDTVFDPFAGIGTTLFGCRVRGIPSVGVDRLPVANFVSNALLDLFSITPGSIIGAFGKLKKVVDDCAPAEIASDVRLIAAAYDEPVLHRLQQWKTALNLLDGPIHRVLRLLLLSILTDASYASNDGQFVRINRAKVIQWPDIALGERVTRAEEDLALARFRWPREVFTDSPATEFVMGDTRLLEGQLIGIQPNILITSPPYPNRYDYTRSYCLELCFDFVKDFDGLRDLRHQVLRSHIESKSLDSDIPVHPALAEVVDNLRSKPLNNSRIPHMLIAYFVDMEKAIAEWARILARGSQVAMVVDNVRFEGELIPVDLILSEMAATQGFTTREVIVTRYKGNSSQQMGKYGRVPVRESVVVWDKL